MALSKDDQALLGKYERLDDVALGREFMRAEQSLATLRGDVRATKAAALASVDEALAAARKERDELADACCYYAGQPVGVDVERLLRLEGLCRLVDPDAPGVRLLREEIEATTFPGDSAEVRAQIEQRQKTADEFYRVRELRDVVAAQAVADRKLATLDGAAA